MKKYNWMNGDALGGEGEAPDIRSVSVLSRSNISKVTEQIIQHLMEKRVEK